MAVPDPIRDTGLWRLRESEILLASPVVMGIVNVTRDSFSDGGKHATVDAAVDAGRRMVVAGAAIIDVGGESTRPGASLISVETEIARVVPVVEQLADDGILVSVDTSKPEVARAAIGCGAVAINDVTGLKSDAMRSVCAESGVGVVIMHMAGTPRTMQRHPNYNDVVAEVSTYLSERAAVAVQSGIPRDSIVIDPGIGFGKAYKHNIELLAHLDAFTDSGYPVLLGTSRKRFLGEILEPVYGTTSPDERDGATAATVALAVASGVQIFRVHNVPLAVEVALTAKAIVPKDDGEETNRT